MAHPYIRFRIRLTRHALAQLLARLRGAGEILLLRASLLVAGSAAGAVAAQPVSALSLGQYKKPQLALALALPVRLLLIDEPFNGLDAQAVEVLQDTLAWREQARDTCIVLTSHLALRVAPTATLDLDAQPGVL